MTDTGMRRWRASVPWLLISIAAVAVLVFRLQLSFDLSAFFPQQTDLSHEVLLEQFRNGPGSRLLVVGMDGPSRDDLDAASEQLKNRLLGSGQFSQVLNGEISAELDSLPEPVDSHYLLMRDIDYSEAALRRALGMRIRDLAFSGGEPVLEIIARDPYLVTLDILQRLSAVDLTGEPWYTEGGKAVLIAETRANAVDVAAQSRAVESVLAAFQGIAGSDDIAIDITGVGAFSVELQSTIRAEATKRTVLASLALLAVLLVFLRKPRYLVLAALPIGIGYLVGLAVVSAVFDTVHGITLAFGFTLMGVAIDYPLHLFSHNEALKGAEDDPADRIWPTMRLGALSTAIAYLALAMSGSDGLAQLGVFSASGILVAVLVTKTWLPHLLSRPDRAMFAAEPATRTPGLRFMPALIAVAIVAVIAASTVTHDRLWDDRLSSLSPVPEQRLRADRALRSATGAVDMRYQLSLHGDSLEDVLDRTAIVDAELVGVAGAGYLAAWQSATALLPGKAAQRERQRRIPDSAELRARMTAALTDLPFRESAFEPFLQRAEKARTMPLLAIDDVRDSPLASWLEAHLFPVRDQWVSLISLTDPDADEIASRVTEWGPGVALVDLQQSSVELVRDYRNGVLRTVSFAALCIVLLLWYRRRRLADIVWISLTVAASLVSTAVIVSSLQGPLTVIHLIALLLVMGLGLDYALFLSLDATTRQRKASRFAVLVCAVSTTLAFSILAGSSIPVLKYLGLTVATGSAVCYLLAVAGSRLQRDTTG